MKLLSNQLVLSLFYFVLRVHRAYAQLAEHGTYSSGPHRSVVLNKQNKRGRWTINKCVVRNKYVGKFSITYFKEFCTKTKDYR